MTNKYKADQNPNPLDDGFDDTGEIPKEDSNIIDIYGDEEPEPSEISQLPPYQRERSIEDLDLKKTKDD